MMMSRPSSSRADPSCRGGRGPRSVAGFRGGPRPGSLQGGPRMLTRLLTMLLLIMTAGVVFAGPAAAHNVLISSDPTDGSTLQVAPTSVRLTFDQPVQDFEPVVTIIGPDGQRYE